MVTRFMAALALAASFEGSISAETICPPEIRWQASFGTSGYEEGKRVLQLPDGGYAIGAWIWGGQEGTVTSQNYGLSDYYLIRLDGQGQQLWDKSFGGDRDDQLRAMQQTADGGFILGGLSYSEANGSGNKESPHWGEGDFWVIRLDAAGLKLWEKTFGGNNYDELSALKQTRDGGFILGGTSVSAPSGNKSSAAYGMGDFWVVRLDSDGNKLWEASFGGTQDDYLLSLDQTSDGGFVLAGWSQSDTNGNKTAPAFGYLDYWLVKVDANGNKLWEHSYGGDWFDRGTAVLALADGDILIAGTSASPVSGNKTVANFAGDFSGDSDFWVLRLDPVGNIRWQNVYGGTLSEELLNASIAGNGFLLSGVSYSPPSGSKESRQFHWQDYWLVRVDANGNQVWDASFGGNQDDRMEDAISTADGGYIVVGSSASSPNGNKTTPPLGSWDIWTIRLNPENANDCDNDGIPNAQDLCAGTPAGEVVNTNGCSVSQLCPCYESPNHDAYVACIERVSADFESAGWITSAQRAELIQQAQEANCPPTFIWAGMVHMPTKGTIITGGEGSGQMSFYPGAEPTYGTAILLGESDTGIFITPYSSVYGYADPSWFMEAKVYGQLHDGSTGLLARVQGTKPTTEVYPVHIDLTPLGPTNLTFQFFLGDALQKEENTAGAVGDVTISTSFYLGPRVNPLFRMGDGSIGTLIEFTESPDYADYGDEVFSYNRLFVRADGVAQDVDQISRVEVVAGGGLESFVFYDEGLGMFGNRHRMLNEGLFHAENGQLGLTHRNIYGLGTMIDFQPTHHFEADVLSVNLAVNHPSFNLAVATADGEIYFVNGAGGLIMRPLFYALMSSGDTNLPPVDTSVELKVFRNGMLVGSYVGPNNSVFGHLITSNAPAPRLIGSVATASTNDGQAIAFSVDQVATFVCSNGVQISGTHFRVATMSSENAPSQVFSLNLVIRNDPDAAFTITGERFAEAQPHLTIASSGNNVTLSWPDNTRLFRLESSPSLPNGFTMVPDEPAFIDGLNRVTLSRDATGSRFFRLRSGPD